MPATSLAALARERHAARSFDSVQEPETARRLGAAGDSPGAIRAAAREFESLFLHQLFKTMRSTVPEGGLLDGGFGGQVFTDMLDMEYARMGADQGGVGLADLVAEQLGAGPAAGRIEPPRPRMVDALRRYHGHAGFDRLVTPVAGRVSSPFGPRQLPDEDAPRHHAGLDIAAPPGTAIRAAAGGRVVFAGERGGYGNAVIVDHGNGLTTLYGHASELLVAEGDVVRPGTPIARVGSTGRSTGPHLHFELRRGGRAIDPAPYLGLR